MSNGPRSHHPRLIPPPSFTPQVSDHDLHSEALQSLAAHFRTHLGALLKLRTRFQCAISGLALSALLCAGYIFYQHHGGNHEVSWFAASAVCASSSALLALIATGVYHHRDTNPRRYVARCNACLAHFQLAFDPSSGNIVRAAPDNNSMNPSD